MNAPDERTPDEPAAGDDAPAAARAQPVRRRTGWWVGGIVVIAAAAGLAVFGIPGRHAPARAADGAASGGSRSADAGGTDRKSGDKAGDRKGGDDRKPPPPVLVTLAPVQVRDVPDYRAGIGTVTAAQSVTVRARVDGQLDRVGFVEGQDVKAGQMLAQLDPRTFRAQLAQVQAQRARDAATLANARLDLQRYQTLIAEDASTQQQVDTQKALVAQLEAAVRSDDAQVAYAQVQLGYTTIVAPIGGRVGARLVDPGNIVHAADANGIVVINEVDPISVVFTLPEETFQDVNRAINLNRTTRQPLLVQALSRAGNDQLGSGRLLLVNNQIDTGSGTVQLKGTFANPSHTLWPGQYVNVRLVLGQRRGMLTVPAAAVQRGQDGTYAYVVQADGRTVQPKPVQLAQIQDGYAVVEKGLAAGQKVVVDGQYKLRPGSQIAEAAAPRGRGASGGGGGAGGGGAGGRGGSGGDATSAGAAGASAASGAHGAGTADRHGGGAEIASTQPGALGAHGAQAR